tara:strand:+ start:2958 stop:3575 length:618 start_codon:yes stop_codon:yes gene_type:complete
MKSYNPFPIIHRCKYDFNFEKSPLKARTMGHLGAAKSLIEEKQYDTMEKGGGTTSVVISKEVPPHVWEEFKDFLPWFYERVNRVWDIWHLSPMNKHLSDSWINVHPKGAWTAEHHHQNVTVACAAYLHVPEGSGRFMVKNPFCQYKLGEPLDYNYYDQGMDWEYIDVHTNDVLFFPGWLTHKTEVNKTNKDRYVMSLNVMGNYVH